MDLARWGSSLPMSERVDHSSIISQYTSVAATGYILDAFTNTAFLSALVLSVLRCTNVTIGAIKELHVRSFFDNLLMAAFISNNDAI